jgi:hypothetical protein
VSKQRNAAMITAFGYLSPSMIFQMCGKNKGWRKNSERRDLFDAHLWTFLKT